ncbi:MAG: hypothetical protein ACREYC_20990, partial [Gammaproteobacteria bacterium]
VQGSIASDDRDGIDGRIRCQMHPYGLAWVSERKDGALSYHRYGIATSVGAVAAMSYDEGVI